MFSLRKLIITCLGHPKAEKGSKDDENHVSRTSSSCLTNIPSPSTLSWVEALALASSELLAPTQTFWSPTEHSNAGIRWPHQSCLEMHQSLKQGRKYTNQIDFHTQFLQSLFLLFANRNESLIPILLGAQSIVSTNFLTFYFTLMRKRR